MKLIVVPLWIAWGVLFVLLFGFWERLFGMGHWGKGRTQFAALLVAINGAWLATDAVTRVPWVHTHLPAGGWPPLLSRFDAARPWASIAGLLMTEGLPWIVLAVTVAASAWLMPQDDAGQIRWTVFGWILVRGGYQLLAKHLALPSTTEAGFADFYAAVLQRAGPLGSPAWPARLLAAAGAIALLAVLAAVLHGGAALRRRTASESSDGDFKPIDGRRSRSELLALGFFVVMSALAAGAAYWAARLDPLSVWAWLVQPAVVVVATIGVSFLYFSLFDDFEFIRSPGFVFERNRLLDVGVGLLFSSLLVSAVALASQFLGVWRWHGVLLSGGRGLAAFLVPLFLQVAAAEIAWRAFFLQKLNSVIPFFPSALVASLLPPLVLSVTWHVARTDLIEIVLAGLLSCYLYRFSRTLWLPIAFRFGWCACRGLVFGLAAAPLGGRVAGALAKGGHPVLPTVTGFGPQAAWIGLAALPLTLVMLLWFEFSDRDPQVATE